MKKIFSIVLAMCLLMRTMCCISVNAVIENLDFAYSSTGGVASDGVADPQVANITEEDGKVTVSVPAKETTHSRLWQYIEKDLVAAYAYDVEFTLNVTEMQHETSNIEIQVGNYSKSSNLYIYLGGGKRALSFNDVAIQNVSVEPDTPHEYRIVGSTTWASLYVDGVLLAENTTPSGNPKNPPKFTMILNNGSDTVPEIQEVEITSFASYAAAETATRDEARAALVGAFNAAADWEVMKTLITETYAGELYITDAELEEASSLTQNELYDRLVGLTYNNPGDIAVAFRTAVEEQTEADANQPVSWTEGVTYAVEWSGEGSESEQEATIVKEDDKLSVSLPGKATTSKRMWHHTVVPINSGYSFDVEFKLNVKALASSNSNIEIRFRNPAKTYKLFLYNAMATPSIGFNGETFANEAYALDTEHTYRVKGNSTGASLYVDGILLVSDSAPAVDAGVSAGIPDMRIITNNGSDSTPDPQTFELSNFKIYAHNSGEPTERDLEYEKIVNAFNKASDWETIRRLITSTYADEVYITETEIVDTALLTQSELYERMIGNTYNYPGEVAIAFRAAVAEQKVTDGWLLNKVTTEGDYVSCENGSIVFDIPADSSASHWNYGKVANNSTNAYNFDISFKAEMGEDTEYFGVELSQVYGYNLQIHKTFITHGGDDLNYDDLGTEAHTFRMMGTVSGNVNAINSKKINFYIDGKFIGLLSTSSSSASSDYYVRFNAVNSRDSDVYARIWDYTRITASEEEFSFAGDYSVMLKTFTPTATDEKESTARIIWAAYDENNRMTSYDISDVISTKATAMSVFNLTPSDNFVPDYRVKIMYWQGVGEEFIPLKDSVEKTIELN